MKANALSKKGVYLKAYLYTQAENGSSIAYNSTFSSPPYFPHGMKSIFISGGAKIGDNAVIFQQVTIGSNTLIDSDGIGAPTIGDNCYIGAGAKIIGNVQIGNNVRVGANAVVFKDIPDNCVVVGSSRIIAREMVNNKYYSYHNANGWVYFHHGKFVKEENLEALKVLNNFN
ncbi:serine acetyltransferase [Photobacterium leiognathi]|nr:serine acetyltransferase [Photobacterium leiognathi]